MNEITTSLDTLKGSMKSGAKGDNYGEIRRRASKFWSVPEPQMRRRKRPETDRITQIHVLEPFRKCWQISEKFLVVFTISEKLRIRNS